MPAPATAPWFMPMLKPCAPEAVRSAVIACLVSSASSAVSGSVEVGVVGDVPVGHDHQVAAVVRVQVEHRVHVLAAADDQPVLVGLGRDRAERAAVVGARAARLVLALDVGHPVGRPQALERVLASPLPICCSGSLVMRAAYGFARSRRVAGAAGGRPPAKLGRWTTTAPTSRAGSSAPRSRSLVASLVFLGCYAVRVLAASMPSGWRTTCAWSLMLALWAALRRGLRGALAAQRRGLRALRAGRTCWTRWS